jgi:hypothetical protein
MENLALENYSFHEVLGEGSCGRVYRCSTPEGEMRAVKVLTEMTINRQLVTHLLEKLMEMPPHPGVAKIYSHEMADVPLHYVTDLFARPVPTPTRSCPRHWAVGRWVCSISGPGPSLR